MSTMPKPRCHNRPPFKDTIQVQDGWGFDGFRFMVELPDPMSKGCQQHGVMGEATLHPEQWACDGCSWKPKGGELAPFTWA